MSQNPDHTTWITRQRVRANLDSKYSVSSQTLADFLARELDNVHRYFRTKLAGSRRPCWAKGWPGSDSKCDSSATSTCRGTFSHQPPSWFDSIMLKYTPIKSPQQSGVGVSSKPSYASLAQVSLSRVQGASEISVGSDLNSAFNGPFNYPIMPGGKRRFTSRNSTQQNASNGTRSYLYDLP